ncbi:hypothetical protein UFOVP33_61 [uncultured Caudovirales phage]|uniref:Uncharacterized protein n=1 Tax=uncultured Caudovirales phage TaxID=2100421 RepID=A0A6J5KN99_9CAUD|nr:hypothetical protein UFOVP33_61 [uncultured Caudovirales phage]
MSNDTTPPHHDELTQYRLGMIEETLKAMRENLVQLTALEQKHLETRQALERAFEAIKDNDERMRVIEVEMPTLKMVRGWVIAGVIGCAALLGVTLFKIATIATTHA